MKFPVKNTPDLTYATLVLNIVCFFFVSWGLFQCTSITLPESLVEAGHKQFLTNISALITILNSVANIINWVIQNKISLQSKDDKSLALSYLADFISRDITLPIALVLETIVAAVYWPLRLFAINLIMQDIPEGTISPIPISVDVSIHLFPIIFLLCDHYLSGSGSKFKINDIKAAILVATLTVLYYVHLDILIDSSKGQAYPYPFLDVRTPLRIIIFTVVCAIAFSVYVLYQTFPPANPLVSKAKKTSLKDL